MTKGERMALVKVLNAYHEATTAVVKNAELEEVYARLSEAIADFVEVEDE